MLQALCSRLLAGGLASCCRTLALCALLVLCAPTSQARGAPADWRHDAPLGAHAMLYLDAPYSFKRSMFQQSADLGASTIRVDLALTAVFIADGTEQWQQVDEVMALAREYRLRPVGVLLATPLPVTACPAEAHSYTCPPSDLDVWKGMVSRMVAHTRGVIQTFEILNEPDGRWAFTGSAADYAELLRGGHDAIRAANPGQGRDRRNDEPRLPALARTGLRAGRTTPDRLFDIANVHIRASLRRLPEVARAWRRFFAAHHAGDKPLWITEFGYPSDPTYQYDPAYGAGPASQASYLCRALPVLLTGGATKVFVTLRDNLGGQFASEGVIAGSVSDPPTANPRVVRKPAFPRSADSPRHCEL